VSKGLRVTINIIIGFILFIALFIAIFPSFQKEWVEMVPGVDITPTRPKVSLEELDEDSAYKLLLKANKLFTQEVNFKQFFNSDTFKKYEGGFELNENDLQNLKTELTSFTNVMLVVNEASEKKDPLVPLIDPDSLPHLNELRSIVHYMLINAYLHKANQDYHSLLESWKNLFNLINIITRGGGVTDSLYHTATMTIILKQIQSCAVEGLMPIEINLQTSEFLKKTEANLEPSSELFKHEQFILAAEMKKFYSDGKNFKYIFDLDKQFLPIIKPFLHLAGSHFDSSQKNINKYMSHYVNLLSKPYDHKNYEALERKFYNHKSISDIITARDPIGYIMITNHLSISPTLHQKVYLNKILNIRFTRVYLAMDLYLRQHKKTPNSLNILVPDYLEAVPLDVFTQKPIQYMQLKQGAWSVYSFSVDGKGDNIDLEIHLQDVRVYPHTINDQDYISISSPPSAFPVLDEEFIESPPPRDSTDRSSRRGRRR
jgi:hypothetical protein